MSRLYDAAEPGVIDEELLRQLVIEQGPQKEAGRIAKTEGIEFSEVHVLRLDFKNIQQIENLWQFSNLTKLQLDNNIISDIKGLDALIHLEWLDLSFNNIKVVQGLDSLVKLRDLSLAHNLIKSVGGLLSLKSLQVLSLGYNSLTDLKETVLYLRQMPSLETLCLRGNEFSPMPPHDEEKHEAETYKYYQTYCLAYLPNLLYLDYQMIYKEARSTACEEHIDDIVELNRKEKQEMASKEEQKKQDDWQNLLMIAYMNGMEGEKFCDALFEEDVDKEKLLIIPGEEETIENYRKSVAEKSEEILQVGLEEKTKRDEEKEALFTAHRAALEANQKLSVDKIEEYEKEKVELLKSNQFDTLGERITELRYGLMKLEMILVEQLDEMVKDFDLNYNEILARFTEKVQAITAQIREFEKKRHEDLTEKVNQLLENVSKGQLEEELPDELLLLLSDKDSLLGALNASHDSHMLAIDNKEDGIRIRLQKDTKALFDSLAAKEEVRNRQRIMEIKHYIDLQQEELEDWLISGTATE